jgi:hypothetical protein
VLGGPGPAAAVLLPLAEEDPEALLQQVAGELAKAQQLHVWASGAPPPPQATVVKAKAGAQVVVVAAAGAAKAAKEEEDSEEEEEEEELPAGWTSKQDGKGRTYYTNSFTKKKQWEKPTAPA